MPCSVPSSPGRPCSTLSATSGLSARKRRGDVAGDVDAADAIAGASRRIGAGLAGAQGDFALGRPASHQNGDVLGHGVLARDSLGLIESRLARGVEHFGRAVLRPARTAAACIDGMAIRMSGRVALLLVAGAAALHARPSRCRRWRASAKRGRKSAPRCSPNSPPPRTKPSARAIEDKIWKFWLQLRRREDRSDCWKIRGRRNCSFDYDEALIYAGSDRQASAAIRRRLEPARLRAVPRRQDTTPRWKRIEKTLNSSRCITPRSPAAPSS